MSESGRTSRVGDPSPEPEGTSSDEAAPLHGVRVLDVTQNLAGPYCGQILADLGATVIKVEPPGGDLGRGWGPPFWGEDSTLFLAANRGKKSIVLDLKEPVGMDVLRRLVSSSDIFLQASRPGAARRLGIDDRSVRRWREDIIHLSVSAYGQEGPMRDQPGFDPLMQAYAGIMSVTGEPGGPPTRVGGSVVDFGTGMWSVIAILAALRTRDATGEGASLEVSLMDTALAWVSYHTMGYLATGAVPGPMGSALGSIAPYRAFATSDGHVMVAAGNDAIFRRLCRALDLDGVATDARFASNADRVRHREELDAAVEAATRRRSAEELVALLRRHDVPVSAIQTVAEVAEDQQVEAAGMLTAQPHHRSSEYRDVALPLRVGGRRPRASAPPPRPGEHTGEILRDAGYRPDEIEALREEGVVEGSAEPGRDR
ncbi:MAG: CoA transferase [Longimicrobiales bacterium]|nr:CoA transferase [Longimicrobiales bacterium]